MFLRFFLGLIIYSTAVFADDGDTLSSILLEEFELIHSRSNYFSEDKNITSIDQKIIGQNKTTDLGELLANYAPLSINSYGANGSTSSIIFRGSSSDHTTLNWNGFPINSLTLGSADLSSIPMNMVDAISITHGASGSLDGSGTFGGVVNLSNQANWKNKYSLRLTSEIGSYGSKYYSMGAEVGNSSFQYKMTAFKQTAVNDFPFYDTYKFGTPLVNQQHNSLNNMAMLHNLFIKLPKQNYLEGGLWYQYKVKDLPLIMGSYGSSNKVQRDSTIKTYIKWKKTFRRSSLLVKSGYFYDNFWYTDKANAKDDFYSIDSRIITKRWLNDLTYRYYYSNNISFDAGIIYNNLKAEVSSYGGKVTDENLAIYSGVKLRLDKMITNVSFRRDFVVGYDPKTQISAGVKYELLPKYLYIKANYSDKFRLADFNEKYWTPGGNPDLEPEYGWGSDFGIESYIFNTSDSTHLLKLQLTTYSSSINNWIQWVPGEDYWYPNSYKKVWARGIESSIDYQFKLNQLRFNLIGNYNYTKSTNQKTYDNNESLVDKELIYIPNHSIKGFLNIDYKKFYIGYNIAFIGSRHTQEENDDKYKMPSYLISNLSVGKLFRLKNYSARTQFKIKNLFNEQYQSVRSYAMPGRWYLFNISIGINKLK